jgi:hypothetical protein
VKIVFLCGSLEPGRDGVGDYVHRLASELIKYGHQVAGIAINDKYVLQDVFTKQQLDLDYFHIFRVPSIWTERKRFAQVNKWIDTIEPDWISLQFVPYAFHSKGLPMFLSKHLHRLRQGRKFHFMFHENWLGADDGSNLKQRLISTLQKALIRNIIATVKPELMHTHLPIYHERIKALGYEIKELPLFSNIPLAAIQSDAIDTNIFQIGIFSQAYLNNPLIEFLNKLKKQVVCRGQVFQILLIGGEISRMHALGASLEKILNLHGQICYTGFLEPEQLSKVLRTCTLGLTPIPRHALGKSGSVAAFITHGIPVAAPNIHHGYSALDIGFFSEELSSSILLEPDLNRFENVQASTRLARNIIEIHEIAKVLLNDLLESSNICRE